MISEIGLENYKSVEKLTLQLGRVTVLIGENGCGKSNILEGIAMLSAAAADKLDNEFLVSRGIRVTDPDLMKSAFETKRQSTPIHCCAIENGARFHQTLLPRKSDADVQSSGWTRMPPIGKINVSFKKSETPVEQAEASVGDQKSLKFDLDLNLPDDIPEDKIAEIAKRLEEHFLTHLSSSRIELAKDFPSLQSFLIYSPENTALRRFEEEGQIQPLGIRGEGLFRMLQTFAHQDNSDRLQSLKQSMELMGWFLDFSIPPNLAPGEYRLRIRDRFLEPSIHFDQRSANEGFLFLLFYFATFISRATPQFFAIDNIDASLNPKMCSELMRRLCELSKRHNKQVIVTTHNAAILDGLNLYDDEQRLFVIYRNDKGRTKARRVDPPKLQKGDIPIKLSEAFLQGLIGGLPKNF